MGQIKDDDTYNNLSKYYLFPGDSCFPMSPCSQNKDEDTHHISVNDQIIKIFEVLGNPTENDLSFL